jgi:hypothetical protein
MSTSKKLWKRGDPSSHDFNWTEFNFPSLDLHPLGEPFTEEEVKQAIKQMLGDKASGPDCFTGNFLMGFVA